MKKLSLISLLALLTAGCTVKVEDRRGSRLTVELPGSSAGQIIEIAREAGLDLREEALSPTGKRVWVRGIFLD